MLTRTHTITFEVTQQDGTDKTVIITSTKYNSGDAIGEANSQIDSRLARRVVKVSYQYGS